MPKILFDGTADSLRKIMRYDGNTGKLHWIVSPRYGICPGDEVGGAHPDGARRVMLCQKAYLYHRLVWLYVYGVWPSQHIDHIDGDRGNNRLCNLRDVSCTENRQNSVIPHKQNKLGVQGVSKLEGYELYTAEIQIDKNRIRLGTFRTLEEAKAAYAQAKRPLLPEGRPYAI